MDCLGGRKFKSRLPRRKTLRWSIRIVAVVLFIGCGCVLKAVATSQNIPQATFMFRSRHLLSVEWEKCDFEIGHERNYSSRESWTAPTIAYAWLALYVFAILVIFIAIAIVCDDFFVPSLEAISEKLDLSEDVAGATFMAAGSSAPELFTSIAGVTVESDVGVGTIVGSAVFNLLVIIALTAAFSGKILQLDWRPLFRDAISYGISIAIFVLFAWDGVFELYESVVLLVAYMLYILLMKFNPKLMDLLAELGPKGGQVSPQGTEVTNLANSDVESLVQEPAVTVLQGEHGTPAGKLPPINQVSQGDTTSKLQKNQSHHSQTQLHQPGRHFEHSHKGEMSKSFLNLSMGRSQQHHLPRLSVSFPILRDSKCDDIDQVHRRSLAILQHAYGDNIRIKSIAQGHVMKEIRLRSEMQQAGMAHTAVTVVQVDANANAPAMSDGERSQSVVVKDGEVVKYEDHDDDKFTIRVCPCLPVISVQTPVYPKEKGCWIAFKFLMSWVLFVLSFPFFCIYTWTIPDCSKPHNRKYFLASFLMSIVWIAILSFAMVTLVGRSGCILSVDKFTMGLVVVAIGTSVPDAISSILVARDGFGDMAVSNAIGSNVFDINLGLGLPFVIRILADKMKPIKMLSPAEEVLLSTGEIIMSPHVKFGFLLLLILIMAMSLVSLLKFQLDKRLGISFFFIYCLFVVYAYMQDLYCKHSC